MNIFAERLKKAREERGFCVKFLAEQAKVSRQQLYAYERGTIQPNLDGLVRLAIELDCTTDFLCGLEE